MPLTGCRNPDKKEIQNVLSHIKAKYAPDDRIALFDIAYVQKPEPLITGETNLLNAWMELDSIFKLGYPKIENKVELLPSQSLDSLIYGIITLSVANLRSAPHHSAELVTQAILGTPVHILKKEKNWYLIQTPDSYLGWTTESSMSLCTENELKSYNHSDRIIYIELSGTCNSSPYKYSHPVSDMVTGSILKSTGENAGFWQVQFPDGRTGFVPEDQCMPLGKWHETFSANQEKILETAFKFTGLPYLWGGTSSKGVDCSGFTKTVYFMNGIILQRDASQQVLYGEPVDTSDNLIHLEPADLLFFGIHESDSTREKITHVGIYKGNGEMIHSSGMVKINSIIPGKENYNEQLDASFICARRILTCIGEPGIEPVFSNELYGGTVSQIYLNERR